MECKLYTLKLGSEPSLSVSAKLVVADKSVRYDETAEPRERLEIQGSRSGAAAAILIIGHHTANLGNNCLAKGQGWVVVLLPEPTSGQSSSLSIPNGKHSVKIDWSRVAQGQGFEIKFDGKAPLPARKSNRPKPRA